MNCALKYNLSSHINLLLMWNCLALLLCRETKFIMNQFFAQLETFASPVFNHSSLTASIPSHEGLYVIHHLWWKTDVNFHQRPRSNQLNRKWLTCCPKFDVLNPRTLRRCDFVKIIVVNYSFYRFKFFCKIDCHLHVYQLSLASSMGIFRWKCITLIKSISSFFVKRTLK